MGGVVLRYFIVKSDEKYTDMPRIARLPDGFNVRDVSPENALKLPKTSIALLHENEHLNFTDIVSSPFLLLSELCMGVVQFYEPSIPEKYMVLLESPHKLMRTYHIPILPKLHCLSQASVLNLDGSVIKYAELQLSKIGDHSIFQIADVTSIYTVLRLDILESMLKRGAKGFSIVEVDTIKG